MTDVDAFIDRVIQYYLDLPSYECDKCGRFEITAKEFPAGKDFTLVGYRQAVFEKIKPVKLKLDIPVTQHSLSDTEHGVWMTTSLQEIGQMDEPIQAGAGRILIGGLGLGVIAHLLTHNCLVDDVVVIEMERDLITLIEPFLSQNVNIVHADLFDFLKEVQPGAYDMGYYDIWQGTGEWTWQTQVVPLRRLSVGKIPVVDCWQEKVMHGQMMPMLFRYADLDADQMLDACIQHYWCFRKACVAAGLRPEQPRITIKSEPQALFDIECSNSLDPALQQFAKLYTECVGTPEWEKHFGALWDSTLPLFAKTE